MKELLSPVGNKECLYAAIHNGADAVYLGGKSFGARKFAGNFTNEELKEAVSYSHLYGVKVYVTVNTIIYEDETEDFLNYIDFLYQIGVDALIMQDIGMISIVCKKYKDIEIHASTQVHNHNNEGISLLKELGVSRIVLDREMSLKEIEEITVPIEKEVFIYGALCNSYSGCCLFSSMNGGRSGNRGECVQSCRLPYKLLKNDNYIEIANKYLLSTKELNTTSKIKELMTSSITSFKIEGRMKSPAYIGYVTRIYRKLIDNYNKGNLITLTEKEENNLKILFNRSFTTGYLFNDKIMNTASSNHQGLEIGKVLDITPKKIKIKLTNDLYQEDGIRFKNANLGMIANMIYNDKDLLINRASKGDIIYLDNKVNLKEKDLLLKTSSNYLEKQILSGEEKQVKIDVDINLYDNNLIIKFSDGNNTVEEHIKVTPAINRPTTKEEIEEKISKLKSSPFKINHLNINISDNIFVSMKDLNEIRRLLIDKLFQKRMTIKRNTSFTEVKSNYEEEKNFKYEVSALARTKEQVEALLKGDADRIYVTHDLYDEYKTNPKVYLKLPRVVSNYTYESKNILATELGAINKYNSKDIKLISDYYLNIVNNHSIKFLLEHNVQRVSLSPEIDYTKLDNLIKDKVELIVYGRIELMLTKSCPIKESNSCPCNKDDKYYLEDINKNRYPIIHDNCLTHIMHYKNIDYLDKINDYKDIGIRCFRLELFDENYDEVMHLINKIKR